MMPRLSATAEPPFSVMNLRIALFLEGDNTLIMRSKIVRLLIVTHEKWRKLSRRVAWTTCI